MDMELLMAIVFTYHAWVGAFGVNSAFLLNLRWCSEVCISDVMAACMVQNLKVV